MLDIQAGVRYKFGTPEHAIIRMAQSFRNGLERGSASSYAWAGAFIRQNEEVLAARPASFIQLYENAHGRVDHAAVVVDGQPFHKPCAPGGAGDGLSAFVPGLALPIAEFKEIAQRLGQEPAAPAVAADETAAPHPFGAR